MADVRRRGRFALTALLPVLAGCEGARTEGGSAAPNASPVLAAIRTDSGVTIMEHGAGALDRAPELVVDPVPITVAGGAGGDPAYDLTYVSYAVPLSDGRLFTFSRIGNRVYLFGSNGRGERIYGRTGKGPGDWMRFGDPQRLEGDTVLVIDFGNQRLNWLTAEGGVVRTAPLAMSGAMMRLSTVAGFLPNGEAIMHSAGTWGGHQLDSLNRSLATVVALDLATSATRAVATIPDLTGGEVETRYRGRRRTDWQPLRLGGSALVTVWDSVIATADPERSAIDLRDASGEIRSRIVVRRPGRAVTEPMRATRVELELARLSAPGSEGMVDVQESRRLARESPFADTLPRFSHLLTSSDGTLWAIDAIAPSDSGWSATAFRRDGAIVGRLFAPGRSTPLAFADDRIIVRSEDADGVVSIQVLAIRYASGASGDSDRGRPVAIPPP